MVQTDCPNVLDFEASGFGPNSYPIEVGYSLSNGERFCTLIKPIPKWQHWDSNAEQLHGISRELLMDVGLEVSEVCSILNQRLEGKVLYSDAWVVDKTWCDRLYDAAAMYPAFQMSAIEHIQSECQHFMWDKVRKKLLLETQQQRHRASADAQFIQEVFRHTSTMCERSA